MSQTPVIIDIYNNPLHAEIFQGAHRMVEKVLLPMLEAKIDKQKKALEAIASGAFSKETAQEIAIEALRGGK